MREIVIMGHLPEFYKGVRPFEAIAATQDEEFKELCRCNAADLAEAFISTASSESISIWEKEIGIRSIFEESLEFRKVRLINRYTIKPPFTIRWLEHQLKNFLKEGFIKAERDDDVEILYVYAQLSSWPILREFDATIEMVLPLSMQYIKMLSAQLQANSSVYCGSTAMNHIYFEIRPE